MNTNQLQTMWRAYLANEARTARLWVQLRERATDTRVYEHSHNTDAEQLRIADAAGENMLRRIVAAGGGDPDAIVAMVDDRFSDDTPQF